MDIVTLGASMLLSEGKTENKLKNIIFKKTYTLAEAPKDVLITLNASIDGYKVLSFTLQNADYVTSAYVGPSQNIYIRYSGAFGAVNVIVYYIKDGYIGDLDVQPN